jgi:hypothetical protein
MSRRLHDVPFVVGSDGSVFVNLFNFFTRLPTPEALLERACLERGKVLIAVKLAPREVEQLLKRLAHGANEAVAFTGGARERRLAGRRARAQAIAGRSDGRGQRPR